MATTSVTVPCRLAWPKLFTPSSFEGGPPKYEGLILLDKGDTQTKAQIDDLIATAIAKRWPNGNVPKGLRNPVKDGDEDDNAAYAGCWMIRARSKEKPSVVDGKVQPITEPERVRSGDNCRVAIGAFAYDTAGNRGVSIALNSVQFISAGERIGGGAKRPEDYFTVVEGADEVVGTSDDQSPSNFSFD